MKLAIGITGASGSLYAERVLTLLIPFLDNGRVEEIALIFTPSGKEVAHYECPSLPELCGRLKSLYPGRVREYDCENLFAPVASGSAGYSALVIVPCSMGTLGKIAGGIADNLLTRAADVMLKENSPLSPRSLILCARETPLSGIHLENMSRISRAGGTILPACPSFYTRPQTVQELADTVAVRILRHVGIRPEGYREWSP